MNESYTAATMPQTERRPAADEPGTILEQVAAIELYLANPFRRIDPAAAWQLARELVIPHARRASA